MKRTQLVISDHGYDCRVRMEVKDHSLVSWETWSFSYDSELDRWLCRHTVHELEYVEDKDKLGQFYWSSL